MLYLVNYHSIWLSVPETFCEKAVWILIMTCCFDLAPATVHCLRKYQCGGVGYTLVCWCAGYFDLAPTAVHCLRRIHKHMCILYTRTPTHPHPHISLSQLTLNSWPEPRDCRVAILFEQYIFSSNIVGTTARAVLIP